MKPFYPGNARPLLSASSFSTPAGNSGTSAYSSVGKYDVSMTDLSVGGLERWRSWYQLRPQQIPIDALEQRVQPYLLHARAALAPSHQPVNDRQRFTLFEVKSVTHCRMRSSASVLRCTCSGKCR